jgi:hypothetical protein
MEKANNFLMMTFAQRPTGCLFYAIEIKTLPRLLFEENKVIEYQ